MKGFILKEFYHIFRDVRSMLILFGMPIIQVLLFGFALSTEIKNAPIVIIDHSHDDVSRGITNKMLSSGFFVSDQAIRSESSTETVFRQGKVKEVVIFGNQLAYNLHNNKKASIQLLLDASDPNMANLLASYSQGIVLAYMLQQGGPAPHAGVSTQSRLMYNPEMKSAFMFVPGVITILLMLITAMMTSISIAREKELGTMEVLLVSPAKPIQIIIGKVMPYVVLAVINAITILLLGYFVLDMPMRGNLALLLSECLLFILMALSLGILISTVSNSQQMAMMLSMFALMLPTILLSGFIFPIENMPAALQWFSAIMPSRWFIVIVKAIMIKGLGLSYIWKETLILVGMTVFFIALSIKNFRIRLE